MSFLFKSNKNQAPTATTTVNTTNTVMAAQPPIVHEQHIYQDAAVPLINENHVVREQHMVQEVPIIEKQVVHERPVIQEKTIIHEKPIIHEKKVVQTSEEFVREQPLVQHAADKLVKDEATVLRDNTIVGDRSQPIVNEEHVFVDQATRVQEKHVTREKHITMEVPVLEKTVVHERPVIQENTIIHEKPIIHEKAVIYNERQTVLEAALVSQANDEIVYEAPVVVRDETIVRENTVTRTTTMPLLDGRTSSSTSSPGYFTSLKNVFSSNVPQPMATSTYDYGTAGSTTVAAAVPLSDVNTIATLPNGPTQRMTTANSMLGQNVSSA